MSYKSPIELITSQYCSSIEDAIYQSVLKFGIDVDKEELLMALEYDRGQYEKGYDDRDAAIVRCKDCKHWNNRGCGEGCGWCEAWEGGRFHDNYCSCGERKADD